MNPILTLFDRSYLEITKDWASTLTKNPCTKKSLDPMLILTPAPTAGLPAVLVVCTVIVALPTFAANCSPGVTRTGVVPDVPDKLFVYLTYNVLGSEPEVATVSSILTITPDVCPVNSVPVIEAGKVPSVILMNS